MVRTSCTRASRRSACPFLASAHRSETNSSPACRAGIPTQKSIFPRMRPHSHRRKKALPTRVFSSSSGVVAGNPPAGMLPAFMRRGEFWAKVGIKTGRARGIFAQGESGGRGGCMVGAVGGGIFAKTAKTPPLQSGVCGDIIAIRIVPKGRPLVPPCVYHAAHGDPGFYHDAAPNRDAARRVATVFE